MKVMGNVLYIKKDTLSSIDYINNTNIDKEWLFMREIKDIILIIFSFDNIIYIFCR